MCNELIFVITYTVLLVFFIIVATKKGWGDAMALAYGLCIFGGSILWIPYGFEHSVRNTIEPIKCHVVKTGRVVLVDDGTKIWEFSDYKNYQLLNDSTSFLHKKYYNMYGRVCDTELLTINKK